MSTDPRAGRPAESRDLIDVPRVVLSYYTDHPDPGEAPITLPASGVEETRVACAPAGPAGPSTTPSATSTGARARRSRAGTLVTTGSSDPGRGWFNRLPIECRG